MYFFNDSRSVKENSVAFRDYILLLVIYSKFKKCEGLEHFLNFGLACKMF